MRLNLKIGNRVIAWDFYYQHDFSLYKRLLPFTGIKYEFTSKEPDFVVQCFPSVPMPQRGKELTFLIPGEPRSAKRWPLWVGEDVYQFTNSPDINDHSRIRYAWSFCQWCLPAQSSTMPAKTKKISVIDSGKNERRSEIIEEVDRKYGVDVFNGIPGYHGGDLNNKSIAINEYCYHLAIEKTRALDYMTEKFVDVIMCESVPIYYGAPNIHHYAIPGSYIVDPSLDVFWKRWEEEYAGRRKALLRQKEIILNHLNVFSYFDQLTSDLSLLDKERPITVREITNPKLSAPVPKEPTISLCTYAMDRTYHVMRSIPLALSALGDNDELIFVDYNDPHNIGQWVLSLGDPRVKVIKVTDREFYAPAYARNCAGTHATKDIMIFMDIDNFMNAGILKEARSMKGSEFAAYDHSHVDHVSGFTVMWRRDFIDINGYDEALTGWGFEDISMIDALSIAGLKKKILRTSVTGVECDIHHTTRQLSSSDYCSKKSNNDQNSQIIDVLRRRHPYKHNIHRDWAINAKVAERTPIGDREVVNFSGPTEAQNIVNSLSKSQTILTWDTSAVCINYVLGKDDIAHFFDFPEYVLIINAKCGLSFCNRHFGEYKFAPWNMNRRLPAKPTILMYRDPIRRLVSNFLYFYYSCITRGFDSFRVICMERDRPELYEYYQTEKDKEKVFARLFQYMMTDSGFKNDNHWRPQTDLLTKNGLDPQQIDIFINIDSPHDMDRAKQLLGAHEVDWHYKVNSLLTEDNLQQEATRLMNLIKSTPDMVDSIESFYGSDYKMLYGE